MLASAYSRGRGLGRADHAVLGRHVGRRSRQAGEAGDRSGIDDRAAALARICGSLCRMQSHTPFQTKATSALRRLPSAETPPRPPANKPVTQTVPAVNVLRPREGEKPTA